MFASHIREFCVIAASINSLYVRLVRQGTISGWTPEVLGWIGVIICPIKMNILLQWDYDIPLSEPQTDGYSLCQTYGEEIHTFGVLKGVKVKCP